MNASMDIGPSFHLKELVWIVCILLPPLDVGSSTFDVGSLMFNHPSTITNHKSTEFIVQRRLWPQRWPIWSKKKRIHSRSRWVREIPNNKNQKPNKSQIPMIKKYSFGVWDLELIWNLTFGSWNFATSTHLVNRCFIPKSYIALIILD